MKRWISIIGVTGLVAGLFAGGSTTALAANNAWDAPIVISDTDYSASLPQIASTGDQHRIVVWQQELDTGAETSIRVSVSRDAGRTWSVPVAISTPGSRVSEPKAVVAGKKVTVVWQESTFVSDEEGPLGSILAATSADGGTTWSAPVTLSSSTMQVSSLSPTATDSGIVVAWERSGWNGRDFTSNVEVASSRDGGYTWAEPTVLAAGEYAQIINGLSSSGDLVVATWVLGNGDWPQVRTSSSIDAGLTWSAPTTLSAAGGLAQIPRVAVEGSRMVIAWTRDDGNHYRVQSVTSTDGGASWGATVTHSRAGADASGVRVAMLGGTTLLVWQLRPEDNGDTEVQIARSMDGGSSWGATATMAQGGVSISSPELVFTASGVTMLRSAGTYFEHWVEAVSSTDNGATWTAPVKLSRSNDFAYPGDLLRTGSTTTIVWEESDTPLRRVAVSSQTDVPVPAPEPPVDPGEEPVSEQTVSRIGGADRYGTAVRVSRQFASFQGARGSVVYIATGEGFPDALVAGAAAGSRAAPLLLTPKATLPSIVVTELRRLDPERIIIVGGTGVVSTAVSAQLRSLVGDRNVSRLGGADRYETARLVVDDAYPALSTVYIATGRGFADALAASAAATSRSAAVVITDGAASRLGPAALAIVRSSTVRRVYIAGGTGSVSAGIEQQLRSLKGSGAVTRYAGADRYETSFLINTDAGPFDGPAYLATGEGFADALGGAALAGSTNGPLFTVPRTCVPPSVLRELKGYASIVLLGGEGVLSQRVASMHPCAS